MFTDSREIFKNLLTSLERMKTYRTAHIHKVIKHRNQQPQHLEKILISQLIHVRTSINLHVLGLLKGQDHKVDSILY